MEIDKRIAKLQDKLFFWEMVRDTVKEAGSPLRDRVVVKVGTEEYLSTYRWEVNPDNGWVTVQTKAGDILVIRPGYWCCGVSATEYFDIDRKQIQIDDPEKD